MITSEGNGKLIQITNIINSEMYCKVLKQGLIGTIKMHNLSLNSNIFQQDNATCHASKSTLQWIRRHNITLSNWPACSPDLNPIENVWGYLEKKLHKRSTSFQSADEIFQILEEE